MTENQHGESYPLPALPSSRVIVTGAAGFLGSHVSRRLLADGRTVLGVDNRYSGEDSSIGDLMADARFDMLRHDITTPLYVEGEVAEIYHLACPASPVCYQRDPVKTTKTSVFGAINMLGLARNKKAKILLSSTSEVYGDPTVHPQKESYWGNVNPTGVRACYDEGKRCAETLFFDYRRQHGMRTKVARIFNTYGPFMRLDDGRVVSNFIVAALNGQPLTVYGDGSQTRSFCYVDDMVEGLVRLMATDDEVAGPINLGNPEEIAVRELADLVLDLVGGPSRVQFCPIPADDPTQRRPDIERALAVLDWCPQTPLRAGLACTVDYFRSVLQLPLPA